MLKEKHYFNTGDADEQQNKPYDFIIILLFLAAITGFSYVCMAF